MKRLTVKATSIQARLLQAGDLFSTAGPEYWGEIDARAAAAVRGGPIGERCYIRTNAPAEWAPDPDAIVFRLKVETHDA